MSDSDQASRPPAAGVVVSVDASIPSPPSVEDDQVSSSPPEPGSKEHILANIASLQARKLEMMGELADDDKMSAAKASTLSKKLDATANLLRHFRDELNNLTPAAPVQSTDSSSGKSFFNTFSKEIDAPTKTFSDPDTTDIARALAGEELTTIFARWGDSIPKTAARLLFQALCHSSVKVAMTTHFQAFESQPLANAVDHFVKLWTLNPRRLVIDRSGELTAILHTLTKTNFSSLKVRAEELILKRLSPRPPSALTSAHMCTPLVTHLVSFWLYQFDQTTYDSIQLYLTTQYPSQPEIEWSYARFWSALGAHVFAGKILKFSNSLSVKTAPKALKKGAGADSAKQEDTRVRWKNLPVPSGSDAPGDDEPDFYGKHSDSSFSRLSDTDKSAVRHRTQFPGHRDRNLTGQCFRCSAVTSGKRLFPLDGFHVCKRPPKSQ